MDNFEWTKIGGAVLAALLLIFLPKTVIEMRASDKPKVAGYVLPGSEEAPAAPAEGEAKTAEAAPAGEKKAEGEKAGGEKPAAAAPAGDKKAEGEKAAAAPAAAAPAGEGAEILALLSKASAENGKAEFKICSACHAVVAGKNAVGPSLWGVVNRKKAGIEGFAYSEALKAKGGEWTFANLSAFLKNPKGYVAGTKMAFAGIKDPAKEADIIAYLATLADTPVPLPK
jgi:cytochrome c